MAVDDQLGPVLAFDLEDPVVQAPVEVDVACFQRRIESSADRDQRRVSCGDESRVGRHLIGLAPDVTAFRNARGSSLAHGGDAMHEHHRLRGQGSPRSRAQARIHDIRHAGDTGRDRAGRQGSARTDDTQSRTHTVTGFGYANGELSAEDVPLSSIAARFGTPCFVYSRAALEGAWRAFDGAFSGVDHLVCYALKANSNLGVLNLFARLGSGFDIVSGGELERALAAQGDPRKIVFSGVGKSE